MKRFHEKLKGKDLRSIGKSNEVVSEVKSQEDFDELMSELFNKDRIIAMRAADAVEKVTLTYPQYLETHKQDVLVLLNKAKDKGLKWHLALLVPRLAWSKHEVSFVWKTLYDWAVNKKESRIVRVNCIQGLSDLVRFKDNLRKDFSGLVEKIGKENIPSINARIRKLKL